MKRQRAGHAKGTTIAAASTKERHAGAIRRPRTDLLQKTYTSKELAVRYGFPVIQSSDYWIAIVELGGGWSPDDLKAYCDQLGIDVPNTETITLPDFDGKYAGDPSSADGEYALDMQVIAGATHGKVKLLLVNAPNSDNGIADGLNAVASWKGGLVSAVSLSWGSDEVSWSEDSIAATEAALQALQAKNIPVFAASGDDGSRDKGVGNNVDYPASSPHAFGCGGTSISPDGKLETAWSYGGGGISKRFKTPPFQVANSIKKLSNNLNHRCVPDGAMDADPNSGYTIIVRRQQIILGGTSAVSPMWSAWKALTDTMAGSILPFSAASVYELHDLTDIIIGNNGGFQAMPGYDLCTGEGVPNLNFTQAWLAQNGATNSFAPGFSKMNAGKSKTSGGTSTA